MAISARIRALALWQVYLAVGALLCAAYVWVPPFAGSGPVFNLLGLSPVVAIVIGVRRHGHASAGPWRWFAIGFLLSLDWLISIGLQPLSFALTGPVSSVLGVQGTLIAGGVVGGLVTFGALLLPGMRAIEGKHDDRPPARPPAVSPAATAGA